MKRDVTSLTPDFGPDQFVADVGRRSQSLPGSRRRKTFPSVIVNVNCNSTVSSKFVK